jgi:hypothetical protein
MTSTPQASPWPAPALADLVLADAAPEHIAEPTATRQHVGAQHPRRPVASLLSTARRFSSRSERAEHAAAKDEQRLGAELAELPPGWFLEQHPPADLVVVGPGGIFLIFIEHQAGAKVWVSEHKVTINGRDSDRLGEVRFEARRASDRLTGACGFDVTVQSVLVLIGAAMVQTLSHPAEVHVRTQHDIRDWLCKQPTRLDAEMVGIIHGRIRAAESSPSYSLPGLLE